MLTLNEQRNLFSRWGYDTRGSRGVQIIFYPRHIVFPPASFDDHWLTPAVASLGQQIVRGHRPPRARRVEFAVGQGFAFPRLANAIHDLPRGFDLVPANEERGVARPGCVDRGVRSMGGEARGGRD